jgi:hypothetical protein
MPIVAVLGGEIVGAKKPASIPGVAVGPTLIEQARNSLSAKGFHLIELIH